MCSKSPINFPLKCADLKLIYLPLLLSKYGQQQLCVAENGEVGDSAQLIFKPHQPLECEQN